MTVQERADAIIDRISRIYEDYQETIMKQMEDDPESDEALLVREIALADYNWDRIMRLYESDPAEFLEVYGGINLKEDIDVLVDWIIYEE